MNICDTSRYLKLPAVLAALLSFSWTAFAEPTTTTLLFDSGKEGYRRYRIPSLLTTAAGTVLAFCEGRKGGGGLTGDIDIVVKRSEDSGKTWQPLAVVADDGAETLGNPCPVIDRSDDTIWLALTRSRGEDTEDAIVNGKSPATRIMVTFSKDDGKNWAPLRDISAAGRKSNWTWYGTGPGIGIQLKSGRLLIPSYHAEAESKIYRSHMLFSDDHGKTWQLGDSVGDMVSECQVAERRDGGLVLSMRTLTGKGQRTIALSKDSGQTWSQTVLDANLYDPGCQASLFRWSTGGEQNKPFWLYSHPAGPKGRRDLTVRFSGDEGRSWTTSKLLRAGDSQYSCLAAMPDRSLGCLYDCWVDGNYRLFFVRFGADWLFDAAKSK